MYTKPLWDPENSLVYGESGLFKGSEPVRLLFPAEEILRLCNPALQQEYTPGVHFTHTPGSDLIYPVPGSGICGIAEGAVYPDPASACCFPSPKADAITGGPDGKLLIFDNCSFFARHQFTVDYRAAAGTKFPELPAPDPAQLPRCCRKLRQGETLSVTLIGDSISEGYNASEFVKVPPFAPPYINIFAQALKRRTGTHISVKNGAISGTGVREARFIEERWLDAPCDLLVIAYGMNDLNAMTPEEFREEVRLIMEKKRQRHPETEFIIVTSMTRHPVWLGESTEISRNFAEAVKLLSAPECAIADLHALWCRILEKKDFYDLTGNGVNHPNDFGHRIYSAVLENLFSHLQQ